MEIMLNRLKEFSGSAFIRYRGQVVTYDQLVAGILSWLGKFREMGIKPGAVVSVVGRFSPDSITLMLALLENRNIVTPLDDETQEDLANRHRIAKVEHHFRFSTDAGFMHERLHATADHPLFDRLRERAEAGIILFTSGSTGECKAAVHSFDRLVEKHVSDQNRKPMNAMVFLKFDHIGGLNTMLWVLMNGGCIIAVEDRSPSAVCRLIDEAKVELLPTTPSFLNMLILSKMWEKHDLSSLKIIAYGTESMPESTLRSMSQVFPHVKLKQTYGLTELGIFSTKSRSSQSTFMAIREGDVKTKIKDGILYIKSKSAMLGYLNADHPFDAEGWYNTGDRVVVEDGYTKILGRDSEIINVGGVKVFPSEVESVLLEMDNVADVTVHAKNSPIVGQIVAAIFNLKRKEELADLRKRVWEHCHGRLETYKIPRHIVISDAQLVSVRLKKIRRITPHVTVA